MFLVKFCVVLFAFTITGTCQRDSAKSSPPMRLPPPSGTDRKSEEQAAALRRQLMRDNYDYTHSDDERKHPNVTARRGDETIIHYQKGNEYVPFSEAAQTDSKSCSAEHRQDDQTVEYKHPGQYVQPDQNVQHDQNEQPGRFAQRSQHDKPNQKEKPDQNEQPAQFVQPSQPGHNSQRGYGQRNQYDSRPKKPRQASSEQEQPQQQFEEQDQAHYEEQTYRTKPAYIDADELTVRDVSEPKYTLGRGVIHPAREDANSDWTDTNPTRGYTNSARGETEPPRRYKEPVRGPAYHPFYHKHPEAYETKWGVAPQAKPFSDLRGDFKEQYGQNDAGVQQEQAENEEDNREDQEAIDQQNISDSQDDGSDYSESKERSREIYNEFGYTTRTSRLQPSAGRGTSHRGHSSLSYQEPDTPSGYRHAIHGRNHKAPSGRNHYRRSNRDRNTPHHQDRKAPLEIKISKKDLLYYMDDTQLRRNNNEVSPDVPDAEEHPLPSAGLSSSALRHSVTLGRANPTGHRASPTVSRTSHTAARASPTLARASPTLARASPTVARASPTVARASPTVARASLTVARTIPTSPRANSASNKHPDFPSTQRAHRSSFVTVTPTNVTYKLLTLKTREGRRRGERRILEERGPEGVAIMSLDHAPLPAFRLPRARRQYMHEHHRRTPQHT